MKRRSFIQVLSAASALPFAATELKPQSISKTKIKPKALQSGAHIGIIAPATAVSDPDDIARAEEALNYFGMKCTYGRHLKTGSGYKSRTIEERIEDLHSMFIDSSVNAIFCIRGGYGSMQLLDKIDYKLLAANPKIFLGYSDITAMHLAINKYTGLVTFHGPVLLSSFSQFTVENFRKVLFEVNAPGNITNPAAMNNFRMVHPLRTINGGIAKGLLTGGNLSLISSLMGTPYEIDIKDKILFLEDVGEEPYRIDRMLTQLRLSGKLEQAAGIIFGECSECDYSGLQPSRIWDFSLGEVLDNILGDLKIPVLYGLTIGHTADQLTLPLGIEAELDADSGILNILESAVI